MIELKEYSEFHVTYVCCMSTLQTQCIMAVVDYIKAHPKASEGELTKEVERQVSVFKERIESL